MSGERFGRAWLALDFIYCTVVGIVIIALRDRLAGLMRVPVVLVATTGAAIVGWGVLMLAQTVRIDWRRGVRQVLTANAAAATLLAVMAALHPVRGARLLLAFFSLDVMSFAVVQAIAQWRRGGSRARPAGVAAGRGRGNSRRR